MDYRILGPLEISGAEGPIAIGAAKHRALIALLLLRRNEVVSVEALIDALWAERPPASARKLLQIYVSALRKAIPAAAIGTRSPGYVLELRDAELDSARFERLLDDGRRALGEGNEALASALLARALRLWRGPALAEFASAEFARSEAARLEELRLVAREQRIEAELALGHHADLIGDLRALVGEYPLRERLQEQLMLALYRTDRQAEALEAYSNARTALVDELGLEPSRELRELEQAILNQDPSLARSPSRNTVSSTLPAPATPVIGRERELAQLAALLERPEVRLVTLTGSGGIGKTRLALEAGARVLDRFANGVVFVELAAIGEPELVLPAIAAALDVKEQPGVPLPRTLNGFLGPLELLLVVDNVEQVVAAAPLLAELLTAAPRLTLLATSRVLLRLSAEHVYPVPPLPLPAPRELDDFERVSQNPSVLLFGERARSVKPDFALTAANTPTVAEICTRLEGVPLAIELAAARVRLLTPRALLDRLGRRLPLLTEGAWDLPARQQTVRATIDWSYALLEPAQRQLLARLAVFVGGWTLEAAEAVSGPGDVVAPMTALLDGSLIAADPDSSEPRWRMLETVHEYALEQLDAEGGVAVLRQRHAEQLVALAEAAEPKLVGAEQTAWHLRLDAEHDNLRAALGWLRESGQVQEELRLAAALGRFWYVRGHLSEGRRRLEEALSRTGDAEPLALRAKGFRAASALAIIQGDYGSARALAERGLALYRLADDQPGVVRSLSNLGAILLANGEFESAISFLDESVALSRELPDRRVAALALNNRGDAALTQGAYEAAAVLFEESLTLLRELGDTANIARSLFNLGAATLELGRAQEALGLLRESVSLCRELGDKEDIAWCLVGLAAAATREGDAVRGAVVLGASAALLEEMGALMKPFERGLQERTLASIRDELDAGSFESAWAQGRALTLEDAVAYALAGRPPSGASVP